VYIILTIWKAEYTHTHTHTHTDVCTRTMKNSLWQMVGTLLSLTQSCTLRIFTLEAVQDGIRPCYSESRTVLIFKFLVKEKVKSAEILHRLSAQYGDETLPCACVYDWCNKFSKGREQVANQPHVHVQLTAVNICHVKMLILENR
jgi:hypothetical protein